MMWEGGGGVAPWTFGALLLTVTKCKNKYNVQINIILNSTKMFLYKQRLYQTPISFLFIVPRIRLNKPKPCLLSFLLHEFWLRKLQSKFWFKMYYYNVQSLFSDFSDEKRTSFGFGLGSSVISVLIAPVCPSNHSSSENHNT